MCVHVQLNSIYETVPYNVLYLFMYLFRRNMPTTDHIFCFGQILEREREREREEEREECNQRSIAEALYRHKESLNVFRKKVLYNILVESGFPMNLVRLIKMWLTETYSRVRVGKNLSNLFPIRNGLKHGGARSIVSAFRFCFRVRN
jgi:hypothetical protein